MNYLFEDLLEEMRMERNTINRIKLHKKLVKILESDEKLSNRLSYQCLSNSILPAKEILRRLV